MNVRKFTLPVRLKGTVLDTETTGLPNENAEVITLGIVTENQLSIFQRTNEDRQPIEWPRFLKDLQRPFYAFNKQFEERMLRITVDRELQLEKYEKKKEAIRIAGLTDPFNGDGVHAPRAWQLYLQSGDPIHLGHIMDHNEADLIQEVCLAIARWGRSSGAKP